MMTYLGKIWIEVDPATTRAFGSGSIPIPIEFNGGQRVVSFGERLI